MWSSVETWDTGDRPAHDYGASGHVGWTPWSPPEEHLGGDSGDGYGYECAAYEQPEQAEVSDSEFASWQSAGENVFQPSQAQSYNYYSNTPPLPPYTPPSSCLPYAWDTKSLIGAPQLPPPPPPPTTITRDNYATSTPIARGPQQPEDAEERLHRLFAVLHPQKQSITTANTGARGCATSITSAGGIVPVSNIDPKMADAFLDGILGRGFEPDAPEPSGCTSVDDIVERLRDTLTLGLTPTRCSHVTTTLELSPATQFVLSLNEADRDAFEAQLTKIHPALHGHVEVVDGQTRRTISATDLIDRQTDNPFVQRTVAKHIVTSISATDSSAWVVRDFSKSNEGWKIGYSCKDSVQEWTRTTSKNPSKIMIPENSQDHDVVRQSAPAFDCRGSMVITFSKRSRTISIQYDHTPLHRTIAQMAELFAPPPRPQRTSQPNVDRKGKKREEPKLDENGQPVPKKGKKRAAPELDENGQPVPKKRKRKSEAVVGEDGIVIDPSLLGDEALAGPSEQTPRPKRRRPKKKKSEQNGEAQDPSVPVGFVQVSEEEKKQRRELAMRLLSDSGVNPNTLSEAQFEIFSNQSPELQQESLALLVEYGAERLQIVHPDAGGPAEPPAAEPDQGQAQATKKSRSRKRKSAAAPADDAFAGPSALSAPAPSQATVDGVSASRQTGRKPKKTRGACDPCRTNKRKCAKEKPSCSMCAEHGEACHYADEVSRKSKAKSEAIIHDADDDGDVDMADQTMADETIVGEDTMVEESDHGRMQTHQQVNQQAAYGTREAATSSSISTSHAPTPEVEADGQPIQLNYYQTHASNIDATLARDQLAQLSQHAIDSTSNYATHANQHPAVTLPDLREHKDVETTSPQAAKMASRKTLPMDRPHAPESPPMAVPSSTWAQEAVSRTNTISPAVGRHAQAQQSHHQQHQQVAQQEPMVQHQQQQEPVVQHHQQQQQQQASHQGFDAASYAQQAAAVSQAALAQYNPPASTPTPPSIPAQPVQAQNAHSYGTRAKQPRRSESRTPVGGANVPASHTQRQAQYQTPPQKQAQQQQQQQQHNTSYGAADLNSMAGNYAQYSQTYANPVSVVQQQQPQQGYKSPQQQQPQSQPRPQHQPQQQNTAPNVSSYQPYDATFNRASNPTPTPSATLPLPVSQSMPAGYSSNATTSQWSAAQTRSTQVPYDGNSAPSVVPTTASYSQQSTLAQSGNIGGYSNLRQTTNVQASQPTAQAYANNYQPQPQRQAQDRRLHQQHQSPQHQSPQHQQQQQPQQSQQQQQTQGSNWYFNNNPSTQAYSQPQSTATASANAAAYGRSAAAPSAHSSTAAPAYSTRAATASAAASYHQPQTQQHHQTSNLNPYGGHTDESMLAFLRTGRN